MQPLLHHHLLLLVLLNCLARSVSETSRSINMKTTQRQDVCDSALELGLALGGSNAGAAPLGGSGIARRPSLTLSLSDDDYGQPKGGAEAKHEPGDAELGRTGRASTSPQYSTVSSFSTVACPSSPAVKKGRAIGGEEGEAGRASSRGSDDEDDGGARKKLRLTKEQSALLEDRFKEHSTLNPKQKQALAKQLNLQPRQVEVWFQNRRARTKLKQTEVDCEILKRCCEKLTEENRRLKKELQELKALKFSPPLYLQFPAPTLSMCPSCERIGGGEARNSDGASTGAAATARPFVVAPKPHFFNPFTRSAAC